MANTQQNNLKNIIMSAIDKIYGTQEQHNELKKWLKENQRPVKIAWDYDMVTIKGIARKRNIVHPSRIEVLSTLDTLIKPKNR